MITIVDYGLGNIRSLEAAIERLEFPCRVSDRAEDIASATKLIIPGVGAFADGMKNLRERGLVGPLTEWVMERKKPTLGICLGFQLMSRKGYEFGEHEGLGWFDAEVHRLEKTAEELRIPHVGWNDLEQTRESPLFKDVPADALFYYTHSFHVKCADPESPLGYCDYGTRFVAAAQRNNLFGTQFHPEKSQFHGLTLLKNFLSL